MLRFTSRSTACIRGFTTYPKFDHLIINEPVKNVVNVQLNRPEKRNALNVALWKEIRSVFDYLDNHECRVIILSGNGKSFCAGIDLHEGGLAMMHSVEEQDVARKSLALRKIIKEYQDSFTAIEKCQKPVIAAVHGFVIGAGISMLASCDIRYSASNTIFSIKEVDLGLAADVGILNRVNKLVGNDSLTRELAFTARNFDANEALKYGLISKVLSSHEECLSTSLSLGKVIALKSPIAVQGTKLTLNYSRDHTIEDSLNLISIWNQSQLQTDDLKKNTIAAISKGKEKPDYDNV